MNFQVTIIGSHSASPVPGKHPSAQLLAVDGDFFLVDCGEGTQFRLVDRRVKTGKLRGIFISHLHGDHYFGLVGLLNSLSLNSRTEELLLFGPAPLGAVILETFRVSGSILSYPLRFQPIEENFQGVIWQNDAVEVTAFPLQHRIPCSGFLFREKEVERKIRKEKLSDALTIEDIHQLKSGQSVVGENGRILFDVQEYTLPPKPIRSYAYCSDTRYFSGLSEMVKGATLMYHEATFCDDMAGKAAERFHATAREAARVAKEAGAGRLLIGHISSRYADESQSLSEARSVFPLTDYAKEGSIFDI